MMWLTPEEKDKEAKVRQSIENIGNAIGDGVDKAAPVVRDFDKFAQVEANKAHLLANKVVNEAKSINVD